MPWLRYAWLPALPLAALVALHFQWIDVSALPIPELPLTLLGSAAVLAVFFKASRVGIAALLVLGVYLIIDLLQWTGSAAEGELLLALLTLNLAALSWTRDRSPLSGFGILLGAVAVAEVAVFFLLRDCCSRLLTGELLTLSDGIVVAPIPAAYRAADLLLLGAVLLALTALARRREQTVAALFTCILLLALGAAFGTLPGDLSLFALVIGGLLLLLAVATAYELAFCDELTGIPSRRAYSRYLLTLGRHFSIAVVDIDHFKKLNDRHGHQVGDQALRMVAAQIARYGGGRAFRYGGEEFVVVLPGRDRERAHQSLEHMREKIASYPMRLRSANRSRKSDAKARRRRGSSGGGGVIKTTVSVGIATSGGKAKSPEDVMRAADKALYRAKRGGRNRVCAA